MTDNLYIKYVCKMILKTPKIMTIRIATTELVQPTLTITITINSCHKPPPIYNTSLIKNFHTSSLLRMDTESNTDKVSSDAQSGSVCLLCLTCPGVLTVQGFPISQIILTFAFLLLVFYMSFLMINTTIKVE